MMSKGGGRRNGVTRDLEGGVREGERFGGSDGSVDGPRFKDLGGMDGVLEELKMEVIIPLYHPQLTKHLRVRILFHDSYGIRSTHVGYFD
ncbi:hypothetical protein FXO38_32770 [Capsicum annuum]|nr:hypothetical protein FXO38_32770 [Capsicum annuum]